MKRILRCIINKIVPPVNPSIGCWDNATVDAMLDREAL